MESVYVSRKRVWRTLPDSSSQFCKEKDRPKMTTRIVEDNVSIKTRSYGSIKSLTLGNSTMLKRLTCKGFKDEIGIVKDVGLWKWRCSETLRDVIRHLSVRA